MIQATKNTGKNGEINMNWKDIVKEDNSFFATMKQLLDKYDQLRYRVDLAGTREQNDGRFLMVTLEEMIELCQEELAGVKELDRRANLPTDSEGYPY